jgi:hypothetical protein
MALTHAIKIHTLSKYVSVTAHNQATKLHFSESLGWVVVILFRVRKVPVQICPEAGDRGFLQPF